MTRWGIIMLIAFLVIGMRSSIDDRRAARYAVICAAIVLAVVFVKGRAL